MKLIVTGASGFVGTEVIRLALRNPAVKSVVAIARKPIAVPEGVGPAADTSKLKSVILDDWTAPYPEPVKEQIKGADACIWTLAVTPTKSEGRDFGEVTTICHDYTMNGLETMAALVNNPFRFIYTSGLGAERDQEKPLPIMDEYLHMRGRVETAVLDYASTHQTPKIEVTCTKPGGIEGPGHPIREEVVHMLTKYGYSTPYIHVSELSVVMIDQCLNGIKVDPLWPDEMVKIAQGILPKEEYAPVEGW